MPTSFPTGRNHRNGVPSLLTHGQGQVIDMHLKGGVYTAETSERSPSDWLARGMAFVALTSLVAILINESTRCELQPLATHVRSIVNRSVSSDAIEREVNVGALQLDKDRVASSRLQTFRWEESPEVTDTQLDSVSFDETCQDTAANQDDDDGEFEPDNQ